MTLLLRNEDDVIRRNIEYHLSQGVDFIIATDHLSTDGTPDILREYERAGVLKLFLEKGEAFDQSAWVTGMARMACQRYGADWVINADADEFWWPLCGDLKTALSRVARKYGIVRTEVLKFCAIRDGKDVSCFQDMIYRTRKPEYPKVCHRGSLGVKVANGNHAVTYDRLARIAGALAGKESLRRMFSRKARTTQNVVEVFHFPERSFTQYESKIVNGTRALMRNTQLNNRTGFHWREAYAAFLEGKLKEYFIARTYDQARIERELASGELVSDTRLSDYLRARLPELMR
jgi:hypothetical protein